MTTTPQSTPSIVATAGARPSTSSASEPGLAPARSSSRSTSAASIVAGTNDSTPLSSTTAPANSAAVVKRRLPGLAAVPGGRAQIESRHDAAGRTERPLNSRGRTATPLAVGSATSR